MYTVTVKVKKDKTTNKPDIVYRLNAKDAKTAKKDALERAIFELPQGEYILNFDVVEDIT